MLLGTRHEDGTPLADRELRDILVTLLMQGHMSTGTALAWALERLTRHPAMLERLRAELESGSEEYLDAVINEVLRLRPPVGLAMRFVKQPYEIGGYEVQPGMLLAPCILMLHRREDIYPNPLEFQPERFLDKPTGTYTWIPFGGGQRHCIGRSFATLEIKVVLRTLALHARFAPSEQPDEEITRRGIMSARSRTHSRCCASACPRAPTSRPEGLSAWRLLCSRRAHAARCARLPPRLV